MDEILTQKALALLGVYMADQWGGAVVFKLGTKADFKMFASLRP